MTPPDRLEKALLAYCVLLWRLRYSSRYERGLKTVCVCIEQGKEAAHLNSQLRLCLGKALTIPKIKGVHLYNLLLDCFLLMMVSGQVIPAISSHNTWTALCQRCKAGNTEELLFAPQNIWISGGSTGKGPHRRHG